jgi:hypothetical protein
MVELIPLDTTQIQRGDIVHAHGMRVLMDVEPIVMEKNPSGRTCYAWVGLVLNPEEATEDARIPRSWLYTDGTGEPRWNVQGNDLATWLVERP